MFVDNLTAPSRLSASIGANSKLLKKTFGRRSGASLGTFAEQCGRTPAATSERPGLQWCYGTCERQTALDDRALDSASQAALTAVAHRLLTSMPAATDGVWAYPSLDVHI